MRGLALPSRSLFAGTTPNKSSSAAATAGAAAGANEDSKSSSESVNDIEVVAEEQETRGGERIMGWWLIGVSLCVAGMVHLGVRDLCWRKRTACLLFHACTECSSAYAICDMKFIYWIVRPKQGLTRLTGSGLSMVKWRPQGTLPPMTQEEWEAEFEEFKNYPEYQVK
jgi:hypothetical protein